LSRADGYWNGEFQAMASPCVVLIDLDDLRDARRVLSIVQAEANRIETKYSRYLADSVMQTINASAGQSIGVDDETASLLDYAVQLHEISDGKFDVTSGVLRRAWKFDCSDRLPEARLVEDVLRHVGWPRVTWEAGRLSLEAGMEIDFGGIGKEYAVDRSAGLVAAEFEGSCLINFGGDLVITRPRADGQPWRVGIEDPQAEGEAATRMINLSAGALATSGDAKRFLLKDGVRYSHILDPTTGWPVRNSPQSATVAAGSCLEAGMLATLAMLKGAGAEAFLKKEKARCWVQRGT